MRNHQQQQNNFNHRKVSRKRTSSSYQTRSLSSPKRDYPLSTSHITQFHSVPITLSASNYTRSALIASSSLQHHHKKLQTPVETSIPSASTSLNTSESSLSFPYQCIRKRDSIRKMRTPLYNHSYNKQINQHSGTISRNSALSNSDNNSLEACSCQGCILGILKKRVVNGNEKIKKVVKRIQRRTKSRFLKIQKSVNNNKDVII